MGHSTRGEQRQLAEALRADGKTWSEIARVLRERWGSNARATMRIAHGWTQAQAAAKWEETFGTHKTYKDISDHEQRRPGFATLEKLAELYECSIADLIADVGDYRHLDSRNVLSERALAGTGEPDDAGPGETVVVGPVDAGCYVELPLGDAPVVTMSDVAVIREMLGALTASDRQFGGGGHARVQAAGYLYKVVVPRLGAHQDEHVAKGMFTVATEFALRVASMQLDGGQARMSRNLLALAGSLAPEADDVTLNAWVLARQGEQYLYETRVAEALAYTAASVTLAHSASSAVCSFLLGKQALALSVAGDKVRAQRALGEAHDAFSQADGTDAPAWIGSYGWGHVRHDAALCYTHLGMGAEAVTAAEESMQIRSRGRFARPRAFSLGVQAIGYAQAGEVERACTVGHDLVSIAAHLASDRVRSRLEDVLRALNGYQDVAAVRELREAAEPVLANAS